MANQSTFAAPQKADNWRAVVGSKLPDGTTDVTEGIFHDGAVHLGNANITGTTRFKHLGIASYTGNGFFTSQVIQTNIPKNSAIMPSIDIRGYAHEAANTVDVQIGLHTYNVPSGNIRNTVWQSKGTSSPLSIRAGWNAANLLALEITWSASDDYFNRYGIDAYCDGNSGTQQDSWFENWVITNAVFDASITQVVTVTDKTCYCDNAPAQTGLGLVLSAIPAPTASQSNWGVNTLGETLHYAPGLGWQIVNNRHRASLAQAAASIATPVSTWQTALLFVMPRSGTVVVTGRVNVLNSVFDTWAGGIAINGVIVPANNVTKVGLVGLSSAATTHQVATGNASLSWSGDVMAGTVIEIQGITDNGVGNLTDAKLQYVYTN